MTKKLIVIGGDGQLGQTLIELSKTSASSSILEVQVLSRQELDITDAAAVASVLDRLQPEVIINGAAYTQVDKAETEPEQAYAVNETGAANIAHWVAANDARLIHISTDFVFDGRDNRPYIPEAKPAPLGVYGRSKLAGEQQVRQILPLGSAIIRTSWLYSEYGNNFVKTMLRLMQEREQLAVVNDQIGSPTSTRSLAALLLNMAQTQFQSGIIHWTDGGSISWYDFALRIQQEGLAQKLLDKKIPLQGIGTADYPTPAKRPAYSVLDRRRTLSRFTCPSLSWEQQLAEVVSALANKKQKT